VGDGLEPPPPDRMGEKGGDGRKGGGGRPQIKRQGVKGSDYSTFFLTALYQGKRTPLRLHGDLSSFFFQLPPPSPLLLSDYKKKYRE
jgi:hypothetical protein